MGTVRDISPLGDYRDYGPAVTFILVPDRANAVEDDDFQLNGAGWHAILRLLRPAGLLDEETLSHASTQFGGAHVAANEAVAIADYVQTKLPDEHAGGDSNMGELLMKFADFARASDGFSVM